MAVCHSQSIFESPAMEALRRFVQQRGQAWQAGTPAFEQFERDLQAQVMAVERELVAAELARYDVTAAEIEVAGVPYQPVLVDSETYLSAAGPVTVERHLYRPAGCNSRSICPLEWRVGIVAGYWTPQAARLAAYVSAELTAGDAACCLWRWATCSRRAAAWGGCRRR